MKINRTLIEAGVVKKPWLSMPLWDEDCVVTGVSAVEQVVRVAWYGILRQAYKQANTGGLKFPEGRKMQWRVLWQASWKTP